MHLLVWNVDCLLCFGIFRYCIFLLCSTFVLAQHLQQERLAMPPLAPVVEIVQAEPPPYYEELQVPLDRGTGPAGVVVVGTSRAELVVDADSQALVDIRGILYFHAAVARGLGSIVRDILAQGMDVNALNSRGQSVLHVLCSQPTASLDLASLLLRSGAAINLKDQEGSTPLICCAGPGTPDMISILLTAGADVSAQDVLGMTAFMHAIAKANMPVVRRLAQERAAASAVQDKRGWTATHWLASCGDEECVNAMLYPSHPNLHLHAQNAKGETPLHLGARENNSKVLSALFKLFPVRTIQKLLGIRDSEERTPLDVAAQSSSAEIVRLFQEYLAASPTLSSPGASAEAQPSRVSSFTVSASPQKPLSEDSPSTMASLAVRRATFLSFGSLLISSVLIFVACRFILLSTFFSRLRGR
eukprot:m.41086 g.41086  ORF g.41086 m.41086 type:complete len:416 (+) comp46122_c0_seq6:755-2002(+)